MVTLQINVNIIMTMIEFDKLQIDKRNKDVCYSDETHVYWTAIDKQKCISVTTLIHQFDPFDTDFWSKYKALEAMLGDQFKEVKTSLLDTKRFDYKILEDLDIVREDFDNKVIEILAEWKAKAEVACERGTHLHKQYELATLKKDYSDLDKFDIPNFLDTPNLRVITNNLIPECNAVLPELLLSRISEDGKLRIAGQADLVVIIGDEFYVLDYKSNREIKLKSFYDKKKRSSEKMKYPLNHLDNTNFWHYTIQLSTYAWIIEKNNPRLKCKGLYLLHHDHSDKRTTYELDYLKKDVERMLAFYKKQEEHKEFKQRNTPINYG